MQIDWFLLVVSIMAFCACLWGLKFISKARSALVESPAESKSEISFDLNFSMQNSLEIGNLVEIPKQIKEIEYACQNQIPEFEIDFTSEVWRRLDDFISLARSYGYRWSTSAYNAKKEIYLSLP